MRKQIVEEIEKKMTLQDYYKGLGVIQKEFRTTLSQELGVSEASVFRYLSGEVVPDKLKREKIAAIVGRPVEDLFDQTRN